ncbi:MAG: diacylglycerol kinase family protein [Candidatus Neomarinimicrobiota bacterium]
MKRILVIANPAARRGTGGKAISLARQLAQNYREHFSFDFLLTEAPGHATELARAHAADYDVVAALGGDGTVNEVVQGLAGGDTPLGLIPIGTGNDFARSAGVPRKLEAAMDLLCRGKAQPTDLGVVNGRHFINAVGIGFDGRTNHEIEHIKYLRGPLVILAAIFRTMVFWKAVPITLSVDGETTAGPAYLIGIGNGPSVGGGMQLTPRARVGDGQLHVTHVADISPWKSILNFGRLKSGTIDRLDEVTLLQGNHIVVESEEPLPVHVDGEGWGLDLHKLDVQIQPGALLVVRDPS